MLIFWYQGRYILPQLYVHEQTQPLKRQSQQKSSAFVICGNVLETFSANRVEPDQTAPTLPLAPITTKIFCFCRLQKYFRSFSTNSVDPDQTAPVGAV